MKWLIVGGSDIVITSEFIEGVLLNLGFTPMDIKHITTTQQGGVDLYVECFADTHEIDCDTVSPDWFKHSIDAPAILAQQLSAEVDRLLVIWDGDKENGDYTSDLIDACEEEGVLVNEVLMI